MNKEIKIKVKGIKGDSPTDEQLVELIKPLIPEPLKGDTGPEPTDEKLVSLIKPLIPEAKTPTDDRLIGLIKPLIILPEIQEQIEETPNTLVRKVNKSDLKIEKEIIDVDWEEYKNKETTVEDVKGLDETIRQIQHRVAGYGRGGTNITLKTNDVANTVQSELNLKAGTNVTLTPDASGSVTIASTGGTTPNLQAVTNIGAETTVATTFNGGILTDSISSVASNVVTFGTNGDHSIVTNSIKDGSGNVSVDVFNKSLYSNGIEVANWGSGALSDSGLTRISWSGMNLMRGNNESVFNWDLGLLYWNNGVQHAIVDLSTQRLYDMTDQTSIDWGARLAYANNGSTVLMNYNNSTGARFGASIQVGRTDTAPVSAIHVDKGNATASQLKFTAGTTTGLTATDGFDIGITTTGIAEIRQRENLALNIYTNNTLALSISADQVSTFSGTVVLPAGQVVNGVTLSTALGTSVYLRGDGTYATVTASQPTLGISSLTATVNETVTANYSAVVNRKYTINSGFSLTIGSGGIFRIL